jgi:YVTN family beta-propeller protein
VIKLLRIVFSLVLLSACEKIEVREPAADNTPGSSQYKVYITNEGNFQSLNSSITQYDPIDGDQVKDIYFTANNSMLGDVCQSIRTDGDLAYIVVNNSAKIEVVNKKDLKRVKTLTGFTSPRYLEIAGRKGFVTDLYDNAISVIDLDNNTITKKIPLHGWTEELIRVGDEIWVTNLRTEYVYVIDVQTEALTDSVKVGFASGSIVKDDHDDIWVVCQGDQNAGKPAGIFKIDHASHDVVVSFGLISSGSRVATNFERDKIYFIAGGVYLIPSSGLVEPSVPFIPNEGKNFYGLGIDPTNGDIYVSDAADYVQEGTIYHYTKDRSLKRSFKAGIIPGNFYYF